MPIKRRPQTYPAFLSEVRCILHELNDGGTFRRKNDKYYLSDYPVIIENEVMKFIRYNNIFLELHFSDTSNLKYTNLHVTTPTWKVSVFKEYTYCDFEIPLTKDDHFNASLIKTELPEWEDMEKLNSILLSAKKLKLHRLYSQSEDFYP